MVKIDYSDKPGIEYELFEIQEQFLLHNRDKKYLELMYGKLFLYCKKLLLNKLKGKKLLPLEEVEEKVTDCIHKLFEYYLRDENYLIYGSFSGALSNLLLDVLYNRKKRTEDTIYSLNVEVNEKKDELLVNVVGFGYVSLFDEKYNVEDEFFRHTKEILNNIYYFMDSFIEKCNSTYNNKLLSYKILIGMNHLLDHRNDRFMDKFYDYVGNDIKNLIEFFYCVIYYYLLNYNRIEDINYYFKNSLDNYRGFSK